MPLEIERKFLVVSDLYREMSSASTVIAQGYLSTDKNATVRVRVKGDDAFITVKGITRGATRQEWEYPIPAGHAREMLELCEGAVIKKTRYFVDYGGMTWEVDEFASPCPGLVVAEVELPTEDVGIELPPFVGKEVTGDPAYYNSSIASLNSVKPGDKAL
jgi:adenylate cyclase